MKKTLLLFNIIFLMFLTSECAFSQDTTISIVAVGDIMLSRFIGKDLAVKGYEHAFLDTRAITSSADLAFANLESPLSTRGESTHRGYLFRAAPEAVKGLVWAGFDVVSLANNHAMDYGPFALFDTLDILKKNKIYPIGAGPNLAKARKPVIFKKGDLRVGFLAYCFIYLDQFCASETKPGIVPGWMGLVKEDIKKLKEKVDIVIISFHWGREYELSPTNFQVQIAYQTIDAGADLIIGHHPHVLQPIEFYKDKPIVYSLGNFVFDQAFGETPKSAILRCEFNKNGLISIGITPIMRTHDKYYPQIAVGEDAQTITSYILGLVEPEKEK
ncbi:MAG: CapA family protein [bacterium]